MSSADFIENHSVDSSSVSNSSEPHNDLSDGNISQNGSTNQHEQVVSESYSKNGRFRGMYLLYVFVRLQAFRSIYSFENYQKLWANHRMTQTVLALLTLWAGAIAKTRQKHNQQYLQVRKQVVVRLKMRSLMFITIVWMKQTMI